MSTDIKIISIKDVLPIFNVDIASGILPISLIIEGQKFSKATKIEINSVPSPEFMILSDNKIIAQIPRGQEKSIINKLIVLSEVPSIDRASLLNFTGCENGIKGIKGIEKLVQMFCKIALQTPGSDKFQQTIGGGLLSLVGRNISRGSGSALSAQVLNAITRTADQVVNIQSRNARIPADERLLSAEPEAVGFNPATTTVSVSVALTATSGRQAVANLTF